MLLFSWLIGANALQAQIYDPGAAGALGALEGLRQLQAAREGMPPVELRVYGERDHDVFLGCLNCSEISQESMKNPISIYGAAISPKSLFNRLSLYRNSFSSQSACNKLATDPPVVVDAQGHYYGLLTLNPLNPKRTQYRAIAGWLDALCAGLLDK